MKKHTFQNILLFIILLLLSLSACQSGENADELEMKSNDMNNRIVNTLEKMNAFISDELLNKSELKNDPWITSRVEVPGFEQEVSLDIIQEHLNAYSFFTDEALSLTAEDVLALAQGDKADLEADFDRFANWF